MNPVWRYLQTRLGSCVYFLENNKSCSREFQKNRFSWERVVGLSKYFFDFWQRLPLGFRKQKKHKQDSKQTDPRKQPGRKILVYWMRMNILNMNFFFCFCTFSPLATVDKEIKTILSHIFLVWLESCIKYWTDCPLIYQNIKMLNRELSWILKQLKGNCVKIKYLKANS